MKAIAIIKLTYDNIEDFGTTAELVSHIQNDLKEHHFINEVGYEIKNICVEHNADEQTQVFDNSILCEGSPHTKLEDKNV